MNLMKNSLKVILYYFLEFLLSLLVFLLIILIVFKTTVLNSNYLLKKLDENNYYEELSKNIKNEFENYIMQSNLPNNVVEDLFTIDDLKEEVNRTIKDFYNGKKVSINKEKIKNKLENNIEAYLEKNNIVVTDKSSLDQFSNEVVKIYSTRIMIASELTNVSSLFHKINEYVKLAIIILTILVLILSLIIKILFKKMTLVIPIMVSSLLILIINYMLFAQINIQYITFWNDSISSIIRNIFYDVSNILKKIFIFGVIIDCFIITMFCFRKKL